MSILEMKKKSDICDNVDPKEPALKLGDLVVGELFRFLNFVHQDHRRNDVFHVVKVCSSYIRADYKTVSYHCVNMRRHCLSMVKGNKRVERVEGMLVIDE